MARRKKTRAELPTGAEEEEARVLAPKKIKQNASSMDLPLGKEGLECQETSSIS